MKTRFFRIAAVLALLPACNPWENMPDDGYTTIDATWDDNIIAATDALYVDLPMAGDLLRVLPDGTFETVDLAGARPTGLELAPDNTTLLAFATWDWCDTDDPKVDTLEECAESDLEVGYELDLIQAGEVKKTVQVPPQFNKVAFSPVADGVDPVAVVYLDYTGQTIDIDGVLNLTEVDFINLTDGSLKSFNAGFAASGVLFTSDASRAVVLSRSQAVVVDLTTDPYEQIVSYPLTMDVDQVVDPTGAVISGDDQYLLISVQGQSVLYAMDMLTESINVVDLAASPAAMAEETTANRTVLVYGNKAVVDVVDHDYFNVEPLDLDEPCTAIASAGSGQVVLYNDVSNTHDVYRLDLTTNQVVEYSVANPVYNLQVAPGNAWAVAIMKPETTYGGDDIDALYDQMWGLSVLDLASDHSTDMVLEEEPIGLAFSETAGTVYALLLLRGSDSVIRINLLDPSVRETVELDFPASGIGALPDGQFYITHASPLGLVTFLDPADGSTTQVSGFAVSNLLTEDEELPRQDQVTNEGEE